jgi:ABC-type uncharacterized transport system permease subunit
MIDMEWFGIGAFALLGLSFYLVRGIRSFLACSAALLVGFALGSSPQAVARPAEWFVMMAGLLASALGLWTVRLMLMRSVSLHLLGRIDGVESVAFHDDIRARLNDLRAFHLVRCRDGRNTLSPLGQAVAAIVAACYAMLMING